MSARRLRAILTAALLAALVGVWLYFHLAPPGSVFRAYNTDPELAYFLDSLAPFKGRGYQSVDHPGTPLTALGTALLAALFPFWPASGERFVTEMLRRPEPFFVLAHALLAAANLFCVVALSRRALAVRSRRDAVLAVAIPASYFAFLPQAFFWPLYWSHNAIAFPAGALLLLALVAALRRGRPLRARTIAGLALAAGVMAATQLYFATWGFGIAVAATAVERFGPRRQWSLRPVLMALPASAAGFLVGTLPAAAQYRRFLAFAGAIVSHQGIYGAGPSGFTSPALWTANVSTLLRMAPWLFAVTAIVFALLLAFLLRRRPRGRYEAGLWAAVAGVSAQWLATFVLLGKHPSRFYLPALAAMLPILLALAFALARRRGPAARLCCLAVAAAALVGSVRAAALAVRDHRARLAFRVAMEEDVARFRAPSTLVLWGPGLPDTGCYALWGVNVHLNDAYRREVSAVCPSDGLAWSNSVAVPDGWTVEGARALVVTTEDAPQRFPAFGLLGEPMLGSARDPSGLRLAFFRVVVRDGRAQAERASSP